MPGEAPKFEIGEGPEQWTEQFVWEDVETVFVNRGRETEDDLTEIWINDEKFAIEPDDLNDLLVWIGEEYPEVDVEDIDY